MSLEPSLEEKQTSLDNEFRSFASSTTKKVGQMIYCFFIGSLPRRKLLSHIESRFFRKWSPRWDPVHNLCSDYPCPFSHEKGGLNPLKFNIHLHVSTVPIAFSFKKDSTWRKNDWKEKLVRWSLYTVAAKSNIPLIVVCCRWNPKGVLLLGIDPLSYCCCCPWTTCALGLLLKY